MATAYFGGQQELSARLASSILATGYFDGQRELGAHLAKRSGLFPDARYGVLAARAFPALQRVIKDRVTDPLDDEVFTRGTKRILPTAHMPR